MTDPGVVVLASGEGSNLQALLDACAAGGVSATVAAVVADRECGALARAEAAGVTSVLLPLPTPQRRDARARDIHDARLAEVVAAFEPALVVLAGWMLLLGPAVLTRFPGRIINVHPALLPDDGGPTVETSCGEQPVFRGARAVRDALRAGVPVTGATVHVVTEAVDRGPVLAREEVAVEPGDDEASLHRRIKAVEHRLLPAAVGTLLVQATPQRIAQG